VVQAKLQPFNNSRLVGHGQTRAGFDQKVKLLDVPAVIEDRPDTVEFGPVAAVVQPQLEEDGCERRPDVALIPVRMSECVLDENREGIFGSSGRIASHPRRTGATPVRRRFGSRSSESVPEIRSCSPANEQFRTLVVACQHRHVERGVSEVILSVGIRARLEQHFAKMAQVGTSVSHPVPVDDSRAVERGGTGGIPNIEVCSPSQKFSQVSPVRLVEFGLAQIIEGQDLLPGIRCRAEQVPDSRVRPQIPRRLAGDVASARVGIPPEEDANHARVSLSNRQMERRAIGTVPSTGIGPVPKKLGEDFRAACRGRVMQRRSSGAIPGVRIRAKNKQGSDRLGLVRGCLMEMRAAVAVPLIRVGTEGEREPEQAWTPAISRGKQGL